MSEELDLRTEAGARRARELMPHLFREIDMSGRHETATVPVSGAGRWCLRMAHTATINQLMRGVKARIRLKKDDRIRIALAVEAAGIPAATGPRRVRVWWVVGPGKRRPDPDAVFKSLLDGLVACGALVNDSALHVELCPVEFARGTRDAMFVELEEVER